MIEFFIYISLETMLSVIYPTYNETKSDWFLKNLEQFKRLKENSDIEFIFVDGGSTDHTLTLYENYAFSPIIIKNSNRAKRLKEGFKKAKGETILFHHPRSFINAQGWEELLHLPRTPSWGGLTHKFDRKSLGLNFTSWYSNTIRLKLNGIVYLDHCLFFHRSLLRPEDIKEVPIFEDTLISYSLREKQDPILLESTSETSSVRFEVNGFLKQALLNQKAKIQFYLQRNYFQINQNYEKGLSLNQNLNLKKFDDPYKTAKGEERASIKLKELKTLWFNTGSLCNLECQNCYIESSPKNDRLQFIKHTDILPYLEEIETLKLPVETIGFTGGEPFINPEIISLIKEVLSRGFPLLILTNAYRVIKRHRNSLIEIKDEFGDQLKIRVSLDHFTKEGHEKERGTDTFYKTLEEIKWLSENQFCLSLAGRTLQGENLETVQKGYTDLLKENKISLKIGNDNLALFPEMDLKKEVPEITTSCWGILGKSPDQQMCSSERMIVHRKGLDHPEVMPCTLLAYDDQFVLGKNLELAKKEVPLNHPFCAQFCVLGGASCSAQK